MPNLESSSGRPCLRSSAPGFKVPFSQELPTPPWLAVGQGPFCTWIPAQASPGLSLQSSRGPRPPSFCCLLLPTWTRFGKQEARRLWGGPSALGRPVLGPCWPPSLWNRPPHVAAHKPHRDLGLWPRCCLLSGSPIIWGKWKGDHNPPHLGLTQGLGAGGRRREQGPRGG